MQEREKIASQSQKAGVDINPSLCYKDYSDEPQDCEKTILESQKEYIFVIDRSGSMHNSIQHAR